jgi:hypothetical protein
MNLEGVRDSLEFNALQLAQFHGLEFELEGLYWRTFTGPTRRAIDTSQR